MKPKKSISSWLNLRYVYMWTETFDLSIVSYHLVTGSTMQDSFEKEIIIY